LLPFTLLAAAGTYIWPFALTEGGLIVIAILYGFGTGVYIALVPSPVSVMGPVVEAGRRIGLSMTLLALGALGGPPISGAIFSRTHSFKEVGYFAGSYVTNLSTSSNLTKILHKGSSLALSCVLMLLTKRVALGPKNWLFAKY
jgi:MFS transporter, MCT family, solute carrier family 16 (monocarboxylic acid transporters), member 10